MKASKDRSEQFVAGAVQSATPPPSIFLLGKSCFRILVSENMISQEERYWVAASQIEQLRQRIVQIDPLKLSYSKLSIINHNMMVTCVRISRTSLNSILAVASLLCNNTTTLSLCSSTS